MFLVRHAILRVGIISFICLSGTSPLEDEMKRDPAGRPNVTDSTTIVGSLSKTIDGNTLLTSNGTKAPTDKSNINLLKEMILEAKLPYVNTAVSVTGIVCNFLLILVIVNNPLKILHRGAWITILNLSFADFLACGIKFFDGLLFQQWRELVKQLADPTSFIWLFSVTASFMLLTLLTVQMYMIIKYPMKSRLLLTKKKIILACMIIWIIAIPFGLLDTDIWEVTDPKPDKLYYFIGYVAVLEFIILFQIVLKILIIVELLSNRDGHLLNAETLGSNQKQREVAKTVLVLNVILFVTAFPWFVFKQIEFLGRLERLGENLFPTMLYYYYEPVALLNFIANPLLYSLRHPDYRRSLVALFKCRCKKPARTKRSSTSSQSMMMRRNKNSLLGNSVTTKL